MFFFTPPAARAPPTAEHSSFLKGHKAGRAHVMIFTVHKSYFTFIEKPKIIFMRLTYQEAVCRYVSLATDSVHH